ncbi:hypothetical protein [Sphingopyxis granuli]|uniref:hypothetical protein n=1 Tax=Sphingopyxis granuli TaxID=267128 RepID=UPI001BB0CF16|nr:hypothetical protein [Sphingopyxis granuli]QUM73319.1 hypothetical protein ICN83_05385 [Sphingopyxis granuli]
MTGGLSQSARILRVVDEQYRAVGHLEAFNRATHSDALREMQLVPAEDPQPDYDAPIGDWRGLIKSLGWRRILGAAAFAAVIWTATAAFAVMCGGPR